MPGRADPVAEARRIAPSIAAVANEIEASQDIPEPVITALHDSRLFHLQNRGENLCRDRGGILDESGIVAV